MAKLKKNPSIVDMVCEYLTNSILNFHLKPGDPINELSLIKQLGVSRSPIREAIRRLEGERLIERVNRKGVSVKKITLKELQEIFSVRGALEGLAAQQAINNMTEGDLINLGNLFNKMEQALKEKNAKSYVKLNFEFHRKFVKAANNETLENIIKSLGMRYFWLVMATYAIVSTMEDSQREHKAIMEAFRKRDALLAVGEVKNHILLGMKRAEAILEKSALSKTLLS